MATPNQPDCLDSKPLLASWLQSASPPEVPASDLSLQILPIVCAIGSSKSVPPGLAQLPTMGGAPKGLSLAFLSLFPSKASAPNESPESNCRMTEHIPCVLYEALLLCSNTHAGLKGNH